MIFDGQSFMAGLIAGMICTIIVCGIFANGISFILDTYEEIIERIDQHKQWKNKRITLEVSNDLEDIKEWMLNDKVKDVIASKEFGVWLRHRVTAEVERKMEEKQ